MESTYCLFHNDRERFEAAQLGLQKGKLLPRKYAHRLAMAVCACKKNKGLPPSKVELLSLRETLYPLLDDTTLSSETSTFVRDCLNTVAEHDYSQLQFLKVLVLANQGNFSMLSREAISTNKSVSEREIQRAYNRKRKPTAQEKAIIERKCCKKLKKLQAMDVLLPMYPGNLRLMESYLGEKVQSYSRKNRGYIELQNSRNKGSLDNKVPQTFVKIWGNTENITTLSERLIQTARNAQLAMDETRKMRKKRKAQRQAFAAAIDDDDDDYDWSTDYKEQLHDDFTLKAHKMHKNHVSQRVKPVSSKLDGGHCYQCHKPFTGLKDTTPCTYHEGYIVQVPSWPQDEQKWSCCGVNVRSDLDIYSEHNLVGCKQSVKHNWRPHAKAKRKDLDKHSDLQDQQLFNVKPF